MKRKGVTETSRRNTIADADEYHHGESTEAFFSIRSIRRFANISRAKGNKAATITAAQIVTLPTGTCCSEPSHASMNSTANITNDTKKPTEMLSVFVANEKANALSNGMRFFLLSQNDSRMEKPKKQTKNSATAIHSTVVADISLFLSLRLSGFAGNAFFSGCPTLIGSPFLPQPQQALNGNIFVQCIPVNAKPAADQLPAFPVAVRRIFKPRKPVQRHRYLAPVGQIDTQRVMAACYVHGKRLNFYCCNTHCYPNLLGT